MHLNIPSVKSIWRYEALKNREVLTNKNLYDLLLYMQERADKHDVCIMDLLPKGRVFCPIDNPDCSECLRRWLNEEER